MTVVPLRPRRCHITGCPNSGANRSYGWIGGEYCALWFCANHQLEWERTRCTCPAGMHRRGCPVLSGDAEEEGA